MPASTMPVIRCNRRRSRFTSNALLKNVSVSIVQCARSRSYASAQERSYFSPYVAGRSACDHLCERWGKGLNVSVIWYTLREMADRDNTVGKCCDVVGSVGEGLSISHTLI